MQPVVDGPLESRMDLGERPADSVDASGGPACQVVIETDDDLQVGERLITSVARCGPCGMDRTALASIHRWAG